MVRTTGPFRARGAHHGFDYRLRDPHGGSERGCVENEVGARRRNMLVPVPGAWGMDGLDERLLGRCMDMSGKSHHMKGEQEVAPFEEDAAAMLAPPGRPFRCVGHVTRGADEEGRVRADGRHWRSTAPELAGSELVLGLWATGAAVADASGRRVAGHGRAYGDAPTDTRDPASQPPPLATRPGSWSESRVRGALPDAPGEHVDRLEAPERDSAIRCLRDGCVEHGWRAAAGACEASPARCGRVDPAAAGLAIRRGEAGGVACDEAVDLAECDRLMAGGARRAGWAGRGRASRSWGARGRPPSRAGWCPGSSTAPRPRRPARWTRYPAPS